MLEAFRKAFKIKDIRKKIGYTFLMLIVIRIGSQLPTPGVNGEYINCIGIIIGILTFFNHFGKKRLSVDPTPMEVEMRLYENDIQTTLVETYSRKEKELDVDEKHIPGNSGT